MQLNRYNNQPGSRRVINWCYYLCLVATRCICKYWLKNQQWSFILLMFVLIWTVVQIVRSGMSFPDPVSCCGAPWTSKILSVGSLPNPMCFSGVLILWWFLLAEQWKVQVLRSLTGEMPGLIKTRVSRIWLGRSEGVLVCQGVEVGHWGLSRTRNSHKMAKNGCFNHFRPFLA